MNGFGQMGGPNLVPQPQMKNPDLKKQKETENENITPQWLAQNKEKFESFTPDK